eukprot:scaffold637_cov322-Prasinococcus_capsulatus_cf.AAC.3
MRSSTATKSSRQALYRRSQKSSDTCAAADNGRDEVGGTLSQRAPARRRGSRPGPHRRGSLLGGEPGVTSGALERSPEVAAIARGLLGEVEQPAHRVGLRLAAARGVAVALAEGQVARLGRRLAVPFERRPPTLRHSGEQASQRQHEALV